LVIERERGNKPETRSTQINQRDSILFRKPIPEGKISLTSTGLKLRKQKQTERELREFEKQSTGIIFQMKVEETEGRKAEVERGILAYY